LVRQVRLYSAKQGTCSWIVNGFGRERGITANSRRQENQMKKLVLASLVFAFLPLLSRAQEETPKAELYVGYDYVRLTTGGYSFNFNGGSGQLAYNVNDWLGVVGDLGGYYTNNGFRAGIISYQFGPRVNLLGNGLRGHGKVTPFAHILFGGARSIDVSPENTFAMTVGGGVDFKISEHFAIRPVQAEYFRTNFTDGANNRQNSFRYSAGIIFRFGTR
jgi:opacity protein-like surface antigen